MLSHYFRKPLKYIGFGGKGKQVRDLLHIDDLFDSLELLISSIEDINGCIYNLGGGKAVNLSLLETTKLCGYITDNQKIFDAINWKPRRDERKILEDIYLWIKNNENTLRGLL
jgi:CDP-paratose 2-epimerase